MVVFHAFVGGVGLDGDEIRAQVLVGAGFGQLRIGVGTGALVGSTVGLGSKTGV